MSAPEELHELSIAEAGKRLRAGTLTSTALTQHALDRIAAREHVSDAIIDKLTLAIRRSHARAPLRDAARAAHSLETYIEQNDAAFAERRDLFDPAKSRRLALDSG